MGEKKPSIRIHKIPVKGDYWGRAFKRPLRSPVLQEALKRFFEKPDNALLRSLGERHGKSYRLEDLDTVTVFLFQEGEYAYVFKVTVLGKDRKRSRLAMIVAKNEGGMSRVAALEHSNLKRLYERCRDLVVRPLEGDFAAVSGSRPGRVYLYFTVWLDRFHELGVQHKSMNFYVNELPFQYFDPPTSNRIKARMLVLMFRLYDPVRREAPEPPKVGAGDFVITRKSPHELKLIACRKILKNVSIDRCIALYLGYHGAWGDRLFHFLPKETGILREALIQGLLIPHGFSADDVFLALQRYRDSLARIKPHQEGWTPLPALNELLSERLV
jgi:hypothetical protein